MKQLGDKPQRSELSCPLCKVEAVALQIDDILDEKTQVIWCATGHVVVIENSAEILVHEFGKELVAQ